MIGIIVTVFALCAIILSLIFILAPLSKTQH